MVSSSSRSRIYISIPHAGQQGQQQQQYSHQQNPNP